MLTRILSALVALPIFFAVLFLAPPWCLTLAICLLSALACYEMLHNTKLCTSLPMLIIAILFAGGINALLVYTDLSPALGVLFSAMALFVCAILSGGKLDFREIFASFLACTFLPLALGSVLRIRLMESGIVLVLLPFLASWLTDTFAYFTGKAIGKHHIVPHISPKKTLEGCIGGTVLCTAASLALMPIAKSIWNVELSMPVLALIMCLASILSQFGDLSMSYIKRGVGIKDYGKLMPGHGGVLDRFDSVLFAAPVVELCLHYLRIL